MARSTAINTVHVGYMSDITLDQAALDAAAAAAEEAAEAARQAAYDQALKRAAAEQEERLAREQQEREASHRAAVEDVLTSYHVDELVSVPKLMTQNDLAGVLKLSPRTLEAWRMNKRGPKWVKLHGKVYYPASMFNLWVNDTLAWQLELDRSGAAA